MTIWPPKPQDLRRPAYKSLADALVRAVDAGEVRSGDRGLTITEFAPYGVIGAITPTTNPTATIINNTISVVSAGNGITFNVHPSAKRVSVFTIQEINRAIVRAGGPANLVTGIAEPTIASAQELMRHPRSRILLVTGGPGVVKEALKTQKRTIAGVLLFRNSWNRHSDIPVTANLLVL